MRAHRILFSLAIFLLFLSLGFVPGAVGPRRITVNFTIPAGPKWMGSWDFDILTAGSVSGSFAETSGGAVIVYVMTQGQHDAFVSGHPAEGLSSAQGSSGNYSASLPSGGKYFLGIVHGFGYEAQDQRVSASARVAAVSTVPFAVAFTSVLVASSLAAVGFRLRARFRETARSLPQTGGVVYFEPPQPPR